MARWTDNKLNLWALGEIRLVRDAPNTWRWEWRGPSIGAFLADSNGQHSTAARARSAAESWLRRALRQAGKRLEVHQ